MRAAGRWFGAAVAVGRRPGLWRTAVRQVRRTAEPGWWRRMPPLPTPPAAYLHFRTLTHGGTDGAVEARDVVNYLAWCKRWDRELEDQP